MHLLALVLPILSQAEAAGLGETDFYAFRKEASPGSLVKLVDAADLDDACKRKQSCDADNGVLSAPADADAASAVARTCSLAATIDDLVGGTVVAFPSGAIATPDQVRAVRDAACTPKPPTGTKPEDEARVGKFATARAGSARPESGAASALAWSPTSAGLVGATDFFIDRAEEEITAWSVDRLLAQMCTDKVAAWGGIRPGALTPETCSWVSTVRGASAAGSLELAVPAVSADAKALVRHAAEETLRAHHQGLLKTPLTPKAREALMVAASLGRMVELTVDGASPTDALAAWARGGGPLEPETRCLAYATPGDATSACTRREVTMTRALGWETSPLPSLLYTASFLAAALPGSTLSLSTEGGFHLSLTKSGKSTGQLAATMLVNAAARRGSLPGGVAAFGDGDLEDQAAAFAHAAVAMGEAAEAARQVWLLSEQVRRGARTDARTMTDVDAALAVADAVGDVLRAGLTAAAALIEAAPAPAPPPAAPPTDAPKLLSDTSAQGGGGTPLPPDPSAALAEALRWVDDADRLVHALVEKDGPAAAQLTVGLLNHALEVAVDGKPGAHAAAVQAIDTVTRASNLALALYTADDPDAARSAIEAAAKPAGGYAHKRRGPRLGYLTLNGYVGGGGAIEFLVPGADGGTPTQSLAPSAFPLLAVGPEAGLRISRASAHPWSLGLQLQLLDLGTMASWRIGSEDTDALPEFDIAHVFSPGLNLAIGFPDAPFSLLVGGAYSPKLRAVAADSTLTLREVTTARISASLAVDIPVLH